MVDDLIRDIDVHLQDSPSNKQHLQAVNYLLNITYDLLKYDNQSGILNTTEWMDTSYPFFYNITKVCVLIFLSLHFLIRVKSSSDLIGFEMRYIIFFAHIQSRDLSYVLANIFSEKKVKKYFILKHY